MQQWAITWGILIQYFIQYGAAEGIGNGPDDPDQPTAAFRIPWGVQMVPAWILVMGLFFFPHSPRWLASRDRWDEALRVLADLHGGGDIRHPRVLAQYREIEDSLRLDREQAVDGFRALLQRRMLRRVVLGMSIQAWSQLCGMNIMMCLWSCALPLLFSLLPPSALFFFVSFWSGGLFWATKGKDIPFC